MRIATQIEREQIDQYLILSESDLFSEWGRQIVAQSGEDDQYLGIFDDLEELGRKTFQSVELELRDQLCVKWKLCEKIDNNTLSDFSNLVVTLADVLVATSTHVPLPTLLIATTIVKIGVREFCGCQAKH